MDSEFFIIVRKKDMDMKFHRSAAVAVCLMFLLSFVKVETVEAQAAFGYIRGAARHITRARSVVKTVKKSVGTSPDSAFAKTAAAENNSPDSIADYGSENVDRQIAAAFAPVFYQGLGTNPRYDYITNFNFDGDWRGDNNWANAGSPQFPLRAYVYYSVAETPTHYFITYAVFHPRDYKGGKVRGRILSRVIKAGVKALGRLDPTGRAGEATLAHENDLEGALVVVEKRGGRLQDARVQFVETLAHNRFLKYAAPEVALSGGAERVRLAEGRAELYIEPRGHGISSRQPGRIRKSEKDLLIYNYAGEAGDSSKTSGGSVGYALTPLYNTLWACALAGKNQTYAETHDYGELLAAVTKNSGGSGTASGKFGSAFRGSVGGTNMARPPWGWFDGTERSRPLGEWFFDPAAIVKRHYELGESFSTVYTHAPTLGINR